MQARFLIENPRVIKWSWYHPKDGDTVTKHGHGYWFNVVKHHEQMLVEFAAHWPKALQIKYTSIQDVERAFKEYKKVWQKRS